MTLVSADYINMSGLLELCCDFLKSMLEHENCINITRFARGLLVLSQPQKGRALFCDVQYLVQVITTG
jgi:hypothetical protein